MTHFTSVDSRDVRYAYQDIRLRHAMVFIFTVSMLILMYSQIAYAQTVQIPDPKLRVIIELALNKEDGEDITQVDLAKLESLAAFEVGITDLTGLEFATNLKVMSFGLNQISDLSPLKGLKKLSVLDLHRNRNISDLLPLKDLSNLTWLSLRGNIIVDMSPLKDLTNLTYLHIGYNRISDLTPLKKLIKLTFLNLDQNRISDLSPLSVLTNLVNLALDDNMISDLSPLSPLTKLKYLNLNDNKIITNLSPLSDLVKLVFIDLHGNQVSDLSPLKNMTDMINLRLQENHITDISPLKGMTKLTKLILHDNHITDFSPIAGLIDNLEEYDASNQTEPPPNLIPQQPFNTADVNRDGVVTITDMVLVASNFRDFDLNVLAEMNIYPDVNSDGDVDIIDLLIVASEMGSTDAAAPKLTNNNVGISDLSITNLTQWIHSAKKIRTREPKLQRGLTVLESLKELLNNVEVLPKTTTLLQNYPNPFNPETWIPFQLAKPAKVTIFIYSSDGKHIRKLALGHLSAGVYQNKSRAAYWNGRNEAGEAVSSGLFFYTIISDNYISTAKMTVRK